MQSLTKKTIQSDIDKIKETTNKINELKKHIDQAGLAINREDIKNKIATNTIKIEHLESSIDRKNKDYLRYLSSLKNEREEFQKSVKKILNEEVKLNITFSF